MVGQITFCSRLWSVKSRSVLVVFREVVGHHSSPSSVSDQLSFRLIFDTLEGTGGCFSVVHDGPLVSQRDASYGAAPCKAGATLLPMCSSTRDAIAAADVAAASSSDVVVDFTYSKYLVE